MTRSGIRASRRSSASRPWVLWARDSRITQWEAVAKVTLWPAWAARIARAITVGLAGAGWSEQDDVGLGGDEVGHPEVNDELARWARDRWCWPCKINSRHRLGGNSVTLSPPRVDNRCVDYELRRPDHVSDAVWTAVEHHRDRLKMADDLDDRPLVVGLAKDLIECVARAVLEAKSIVVTGNADFSKVINEAHV